MQSGTLLCTDHTPITAQALLSHPGALAAGVSPLPLDAEWLSPYSHVRNLMLALAASEHCEGHPQRLDRFKGERSSNGY